MLDGKGNAVLVDFGVSSFFTNSDEVKATVGSLRYFSPEMVKTGEKKVFGYKTDVWALGTTIYQMATKTFPFQGNTISEIQF